MTESLLRFAPVLCVLIVAAYCDVRTGLIPNRITILGLGVILPAQLVMHAYLLRGGPSQLLGLLGLSMVGLAVCSVAPLTLYFAKGMGGGDVKLLALQGALLGPSLGIEVELYAFVLIALYAMAKLAYRGRLLAMLTSTVGLTRNAFVRKERQKPIPHELLTSLRFAPFVLVAALLISSMGAWVR